MPFPGIFIGMDEAGYGPNLGPLLLTVTRWRTPADPGDCDFYGLLGEAIDGTSSRRGTRLHVADSKLVNAGKSGFRSLETTALALLECGGCSTESFRSIVAQLTAGEQFSPTAPPWYGKDLALPREAAPETILLLSEQLRCHMERQGIGLEGIHCDLVTEERFNELLDQHGSKGILLSRLAFRLLRRAWSPDELSRTLFVGDKHGGRNRYDELLAEVVGEDLIFRVREGRELSVYRVRQTELRFQVRGERHLPVAAASIVSKYLRELAMDLFNGYWREHCPDVPPTRGYPVDALRFRRSIEPALSRLALDPRLLWRER